MPTPKTNPCLKVCVSPCGTPVVGAVVSLYDRNTGDLVGSCTTDKTGCCNPKATGQLTLVVAAAGETIHNAPITIAVTAQTIGVGVDGAHFVCCGSIAVPRNLTLTDANGSMSFAYDGVSAWVANTFANATATIITTEIVVGVTECVVSSGDTQIWVSYVMRCDRTASPAPKLVLTRTWTACSTSVDPTWRYIQGVAPTGAAGCGGTNTCTNIDVSTPCNTSTDSQAPSSSAPFAITFNPAPTTGGFNPNVTADPVGGSVVVSA